MKVLESNIAPRHYITLFYAQSNFIFNHTSPTYFSDLSTLTSFFDFLGQKFTTEIQLQAPTLKPDPQPTHLEQQEEHKKQNQLQKQPQEQKWGETITPVKKGKAQREALRTTFEKERSESSEYNPKVKQKKSKKKRIAKRINEKNKKEENLAVKLF